MLDAKRDGMTVANVAELFNLSKARVYQIYRRLNKKLERLGKDAHINDLCYKVNNGKG